MSDDYSKKYASLIRMCHEAQDNGMTEVVVYHPYSLGDTYEELVESLDRIAAAGLALRIVPPAERARKR